MDLRKYDVIIEYLNTDFKFNSYNIKNNENIMYYDIIFDRLYFNIEFYNNNHLFKEYILYYVTLTIKNNLNKDYTCRIYQKPFKTLINDNTDLKVTIKRCNNGNIQNKNFW